MQIDVFQIVPHTGMWCSQVVKIADAEERPGENNSMMTFAGPNNSLEDNRQIMFDDKPFKDGGTTLL